CGHYRICPPERSDGGRDPLAGTTGSVPQSEAMGEGTRLRVGGHQTRPRTPETPTSGVPTPSPAPPVLTGSVPQSEAMGEGTRLRVGGRHTRPRTPGTPTAGVPAPSPAPAGLTGSVPQSEAMGEGTRLRALRDLSPRAKRWGKGPACG